MGLVSGWFKERLTTAKQNSVMQSGLADIVESLFIAVVEPYLTRITHRKSFFTMADADLDTRIQEMGQFFTIRSSDASSKPMLLQQRLDEIHFKGTSRPITQTFYREYNGVPITWQPQYAPVDVKKYPYGTRLVAENNLDAVGDAYGEMFLTSRGVISIPYSELVAIIREGKNPSIVTVAQVSEDAFLKFKQVSVPLLPLHIVFDGLQMLVDWTFQEPDDELILISIETEAEYAAIQEITEVMAVTDVAAGDMVLDAQDTETEEWTHAKYDNVRLDDWILDVMDGLDKPIR